MTIRVEKSRPSHRPKEHFTHAHPFADTPDAVITIDSGGRTLLWNAAAEEMFGYAETEAVGRELTELILPSEEVYPNDEWIIRLLIHPQSSNFFSTVDFIARDKQFNLFTVSCFVFQTSQAPDPQYTMVLRFQNEEAGTGGYPDRHPPQKKNHQPAEVMSMKRSREQVKLLRELAGTIEEQIDIERILQWTVNRVGQLIRADRCVVIEYDACSDRFYPPEYEYLASPAIPSVLGLAPEEIPFLQEWKDAHEPILIPDIRLVAGLTEKQHQSIEAKQSQSVLHVPIRYKGECLGFFRIHSVGRKANWDSRTLAMVKEAAVQVATPIYESRLLQELAFSLDALRRSEARFRKIVESNMVGFFFGDQNGRIFDANEAMLEMLGYSRADMIAGRINWTDFMSTCLKSWLTGKEQPGFCQPCETQFTCPNGKTRDFVVGMSILERDPLTFVGFVLDISEKKRAERALLESEERYRAVIQGSNDGIWDLRVNDHRSSVNNRFLEIMGEPPRADNSGGIVDLKFWDRIHPDDLSDVKAAFQKHLEDATFKYEVNFRLRQPSGEYRHVLSKAVALRDEKGTPYRMAGVLTDITERVQTEQALRESEKHFRELADASPILICIFDTLGAITYVNKTCQEFCGISDLSEILDWKDRVHPDDVVEADRLFANAFKTRQPYQTENRLRHHSGVYRWISISVVPMFSLSGDLAGMIVSCIDIHDTKEITLRLQTAEERYRLAVDASQEAIWDLDVRTGNIFWNNTIYKLLGFPESLQPDYQFFLGIIHPDDRPMYFRKLKNHFEADEPYEIDFRLQNHDGTYHYWHSRGKVTRNDSGEPVRFTGMIKKLPDDFLPNQV